MAMGPAMAMTVNAKLGIFIVLTLFSIQVIGEDYFKPGIEITKAYTDNVNLSDDAEKESAIVDILSFKLDWQKESPYFSSRLDFSWEGLNYTDYPYDDIEYTQYYLDTNFHSINKDFKVGIKSSRDQVYSTFLRAKSISNINITDNRADYSANTGYVRFNKQITSRFRMDFDLSHSDISYDSDQMVVALGDVFDDSEVDTVSLNLSSDNGRSKQWYVNSSMSNTTRDNYAESDSKYESIDAGFYIPLTKGWDIAFRGGYINDDIKNIETEINGDYFSAGIRYNAPSMFSFSALKGDLFSEVTFDYRAKQRSYLNVTYRDNALGQLRGTQLDVSWRSIGRRVDWKVLRRRSVENFATETILRIPRDGFDLGSLTPDDTLDLVSYEAVISDFVLTRNELSWVYKLTKTNVMFQASKGERKPIGQDFVFQDFKVQRINIEHRFNRRHFLNIEYTNETANFPLTDEDAKLAQVSLKWRKHFSYRSFLSFEISDLEQSVAINNLDFSETRVELSFTKTL